MFAGKSINTKSLALGNVSKLLYKNWVSFSINVLRGMSSKCNAFYVYLIAVVRWTTFQFLVVMKMFCNTIILVFHRAHT